MPTPVAAASLENYRRRVAAFALLNVSVLAAVFLLHVGFTQVLGAPRPALLAFLATLFAGQVVLLLWSDGLREPPGERLDRWVTAGSIAFTLAGATLASRFGEGEEHHYYVLMLPAIVLAAFRLGWGGTLLTVGSACALTLWDVWSWYVAHPPAHLSEYFESVTVCLMFTVVGVVVRLLAADLRRSGADLARSLGELAHAQDRLVSEERLAAVGRLSSAIAHEIRNPVAMIHSSLAAASRGGLDATAREQMFAVATQEAERLEKLTGDFLAYAHTRTPQPQRTGAAETLSVVAELVRARATEAGVRVRVAAGEERGFFDPFMLHQALLNLAINGVAATRKGGELTLGANRVPDGVVLWVENEGDPVGREAAGLVFEPFFTTRAGGTGLGLAIARGIARAHGGDAALERNEPGAVRFSLRLPDGGATAGA